MPRSRSSRLKVITAAGAFTAALGLGATVASSQISARSIGPVPDAAFVEGEEPIRELFPDYIPAAGPIGIAGFVRSADIFEQTDKPELKIVSIPVFDSDLHTVVGHMVDGAGFVALGDIPMPMEITVEYGEEQER